MTSPNVSETASVSVVIPCWRCADTIGRAVASVDAQTLRPREIILVDDASGDDTLAVLHGLVERGPPGWIKVVALPQNGGPGIARNAGWAEATGDHIALLDADDAWHPRKLEIQMAYMAQHPDLDLTGHASRFVPEGAPLPAVEGPPVARAVALRALLVRNPVLTRTVVMKRTLPLRFGGRAVTEDFLFWLQVLRRGYSVRVLDLPLAVTFRPEFSPGGYSGDLWTHEKRELRALAAARRDGILSGLDWLWASAWSFAKYLRRVAINAGRGGDA